MYSLFSRFAMGSSITQVGKKALFATAAGAFAYNYAQECKNDVFYFNKTK